MKLKLHIKEIIFYKITEILSMKFGLSYKIDSKVVDAADYGAN